MANRVKRTAHQTRDVQRTTEAILRAAKDEFSQNGLNGARVDVIAERSGFNKRMIYHYFKSKDGLFKAVLEVELGKGMKSLSLAPADTEGAFRHWFEYLSSNLDGLKLEQWEALQTSSSDIINETERRAVFTQAAKGVRQSLLNSKRGKQMDAAQFLLMVIAMNSYPLLFPQITKLVTGLAPTDPKFKEKHLETFRLLLS